MFTTFNILKFDKSRYRIFHEKINGNSFFDILKLSLKI